MMKLRSDFSSGNKPRRTICSSPPLPLRRPGRGPDHRDQRGEHAGHDPRQSHRADQVRGPACPSAAEEGHGAGAGVR